MMMPISDLLSAVACATSSYYHPRSRQKEWTCNAINPQRQVLEDRLSDKKEALLEKELVLEEVVSLTKKLRKQASDGRQETLELSKKVWGLWVTGA